ncbi:MAG: hypothetical protein DRG11_00490 [Epsilonproteobacteria bacterium]|nr:MAG: hypothetical protein DRG11_00490 [Campylobacterota bacterium]
MSLVCSDFKLLPYATGEYWDSQLKATDDKSYVDDWIENHPDGEILVTDELATKMGLDSSGIENADVTMRVEDFVDELIKSDQANSLSTYFPVIAIASVAIIVQEIYRRYKAGEISYSKFKLLVGIAVGEKSIKIGVLTMLLAIPGINVIVGAGLVAGLIYSARKFATNSL